MGYVLNVFTGWNSQDRNMGKEQDNTINGTDFIAVILTLFGQFWSDFGISKSFYNFRVKAETFVFSLNAGNYPLMG